MCYTLYRQRPRSPEGRVHSWRAQPNLALSHIGMCQCSPHLLRQNERGDYQNEPLALRVVREGARLGGLEHVAGACGATPRRYAPMLAVGAQGERRRQDNTYPPTYTTIPPAYAPPPSPNRAHRLIRPG